MHPLNVGHPTAAAFIVGTLYQIKGDSHNYVQTWRVHGGQLKQAKRVQWSGVAGYLPITDAAVVAQVDGAMERWKLLLAGKVGGKRDTGTGGGKRRATTPTYRGTVLVCPVPRNQTLVPRGGPYSPHSSPVPFVNRPFES